MEDMVIAEADSTVVEAFTQAEVTGSGSHYGGHSGGGGNNPLSGLIVGIIGIVISSLVTFFLGFDLEMIYFFIVSVVVFFVSLGRLISDSAKKLQNLAESLGQNISYFQV